MGTVLVKIKIMPESPNVNLKEIQEKAKEIVLKNGGQRPETQTEPIAFGLNAVILAFAIDESKSMDPLENNLRRLKHISSAEVIDFRRAFG